MTSDIEKRLIKKYANRRLYDTATSKHVTVDGLRQLVVAGENIQVIDDSSGDDITNHLLLQIIVEQEVAGKPLLNTELLTGIIRYYGHPMQEMMGRYLANSMENFLAQQNVMQQQMMAMLTPDSAMESFQSMTKTNIEAWQAMQRNMLGNFFPEESKSSKD